MRVAIIGFGVVDVNAARLPGTRRRVVDPVASEGRFQRIEQLPSDITMRPAFAFRTRKSWRSFSTFNTRNMRWFRKTAARIACLKIRDFARTLAGRTGCMLHRL